MNSGKFQQHFYNKKCYTITHTIWLLESFFQFPTSSSNRRPGIYIFATNESGVCVCIFLLFLFMFSVCLCINGKSCVSCFYFILNYMPRLERTWKGIVNNILAIINLLCPGTQRDYVSWNIFLVWSGSFSKLAFLLLTSPTTTNLVPLIFSFETVNYVEWKSRVSSTFTYISFQYFISLEK